MASFASGFEAESSSEVKSIGFGSFEGLDIADGSGHGVLGVFGGAVSGSKLGGVGLGSMAGLAVAGDFGLGVIGVAVEGSGRGLVGGPRSLSMVLGFLWLEAQGR